MEEQQNVSPVNAFNRGFWDFEDLTLEEKLHYLETTIHSSDEVAREWLLKEFKMLIGVIERYADPSLWEGDRILYDDCDQVKGKLAGGCMARSALRDLHGEMVEPNEGFEG